MQGGDIMERGYSLQEYSDVLLPEDIQKILKVGRNTVYTYLANGTIKSVRIAGKYRIPKKYILDFLYGGDSPTLVKEGE